MHGAFFRRVPLTVCHGRRGFFNFAKYSLRSSSSQSSLEKTQTYHERKILPYRPSELYNVITDVKSYPSFVPYCTSSRIVESETRHNGVTVMEAELTIGFLAFKESYTSTVTCKPHEFVEAVASSSSPLFKTLTTIWRMKPLVSSPLDREPTLVTLDLAFAFANPMHATVSATFFGQVSKLMVKAFEQRCVALYGTRTE